MGFGLDEKAIFFDNEGNVLDRSQFDAASATKELSIDSLQKLKDIDNTLNGLINNTLIKISTEVAKLAPEIKAVVNKLAVWIDNPQTFFSFLRDDLWESFKTWNGNTAVEVENYLRELLKDLIDSIKDAFVSLPNDILVYMGFKSKEGSKDSEDISWTDKMTSMFGFNSAEKVNALNETMKAKVEPSRISVANAPKAPSRVFNQPAISSNMPYGNTYIDESTTTVEVKVQGGNPEETKKAVMEAIEEDRALKRFERTRNKASHKSNIQ